MEIMNKGNVLRGGKRGKNSPINLPLLDESFIKFVSSKNFIIFVRFYLVFYEVRTQLAIFLINSRIPFVFGEVGQINKP